MQPVTNDRAEFQRVFPEFLEFVKKTNVPPRMRTKLLLMAKLTTGQTITHSDAGELDADEVAQLEQMPSLDRIRLFLSVTRCLMGKEDYQFAVKKEAYVKRDAVFAFWHLCYITYNNSAVVITRKKPMELPLEGLRISSKVKKSRSRYCFVLASPKGRFRLGFPDEKVAQDMYDRICSLLKNKYDSLGKMAQLTQSKIIEDEGNTNIEDPDEEQRTEALRQEEETKHRLEEYCVEDLEDDNDYRIEESLPHGRLLVHRSNPLIAKIALVVECPSAEAVMDYFAQTKEWNTSLAETAVVCRIDENAYIIYEKYKAYNFASWPRDFVVLKTAAKIDNKVYLLERSVEHADYLPGKTAVRGNIIRKATVFINRENNPKTLMITKVEIDYSGHNSAQDNTAMSVQMLRTFTKFPKYCQQKSIGQGVVKLFSFKKHRSTRKESFDTTNGNILPSDLTERKPTEEVRKVRPFQNLLQHYLGEQIEEELLQRITQNEHHWYYLHNKYELVQKQPGQQYQLKDDFVYQRGDWQVNQQNQLVFVNQQVIDAQKDVLKYILKQIGSNLFSGKSVMNMSLPVDIFDQRSILERCAGSYGYAPIFLQQAAKATDDLSRVAWIATFMATTCLLELRIEKPFNPILGETLQGFIAGIPIYFEQISHHPPISSFYMKCEDFTFYGSIIYNVEMGLNSCVGSQPALSHVVLPNGDHFEFMVAGGEVSGLVFGERKFRLVNKAFVVERKKQLFCEISMGKDKPQLYPSNKKLSGCDLMGGVFKVTPQFIERFAAEKKRQKFAGVSKKDVLEKLAIVQGSWNGDILFNGKCYKRLYQPMPYKLEYEQFPLPSNSNFRFDILYRRMGNLPQSQRTKEELENLQRADKKHRSPGKH